jgi:hypothetical protein
MIRKIADRYRPARMNWARLLVTLGLAKKIE